MAETISDRVKSARKKAELTQKQCLELSGLTKQGWINVERGYRSSPRPDTLQKMCLALGCDYQWLATGAGSAYPKKKAPAPRQEHQALKGIGVGTELPGFVHIKSDKKARKETSSSPTTDPQEKGGGHLKEDGFPAYMDRQQVQKALGISRDTFFKMVKEKRMPGAFRLGGKGMWRVVRQELEDYVTNQVRQHQT
jgi:excisionase family DNA binding protein